MHKLMIQLWAIILSIAACFGTTALACTDFRITAQDGTVVM